jgi:hypothetical protein
MVLRSSVPQVDHRQDGIRRATLVLVVQAAAQAAQVAEQAKVITVALTARTADIITRHMCRQAWVQADILFVNSVNPAERSMLAEVAVEPIMMRLHPRQAPEEAAVEAVVAIRTQMVLQEQQTPVVVAEVPDMAALAILLLVVPVVPV